MELQGTIPPMVTPVETRTGGVDVAALGEFVEFLVDGGVHGLFPCGSIGEFASLSDEERYQVLQAVVDRADGVPVIAGCGGTSLSEVLGYITMADGAGADAAVVVTPYYLTTDQAGLREFYQVVADNASLPIVLYNIPPLTRHSLSVETVVELAAHEDIVGIKDSSGDAGYHLELLEAVPEDFAVIQGISTLSVTSLDAGADGIISGAANVFPGEAAELYEAHRAGDRDRAVALANDVLNPIVTAFGDAPTAAALKHLVAEAGIDAGPPMLPLSELDEAARTRLADRYAAVSDALEASTVG